jgi:hypothetical protein
LGHPAFSNKTFFHTTIEVEEEKAIEDKLEKESKPLIKVKES